MGFLKTLQLFNNTVGVLRIIFRNPCFNTGGIEDCYVGKNWIQLLAYRFGQVNIDCKSNKKSCSKRVNFEPSGTTSKSQKSRSS